MATTVPPTVAAAGTLPWRRRRGSLQVALVHRPRYDDWSWPKGKLDDGEAWPIAGVRETSEETGLEVRLGLPLPPAHYSVASRSGATPKEVRYWTAEVVGGDGELRNEVDDVAWLDVDAARRRLDHARDRDQLEALVDADHAGVLTTWPLAFVRHAKAEPRRTWPDDDRLRPLDDRGRGQARDLVPLLAAYGPTRLVSSPSVRCTDTLAPYAAHVGSPLHLRPGLSEEGYAEDADRAGHDLGRLLEQGTASAVCSHRRVLPALLDTLARLADPTDAALPLLEDAATGGLRKGEALVAHVVGSGDAARIVAVERHTP